MILTGFETQTCALNQLYDCPCPESVQHSISRSNMQTKIQTKTTDLIEPEEPVCQESKINVEIHNGTLG